MGFVLRYVVPIDFYFVPYVKILGESHKNVYQKQHCILHNKGLKNLYNMWSVNCEVT